MRACKTEQLYILFPKINNRRAQRVRIRFRRSLHEGGRSCSSTTPKTSQEDHTRHRTRKPKPFSSFRTNRHATCRSTSEQRDRVRHVQVLAGVTTADFTENVLRSNHDFTGNSPPVVAAVDASPGHAKGLSCCLQKTNVEIIAASTRGLLVPVRVAVQYRRDHVLRASASPHCRDNTVLDIALSSSFFCAGFVDSWPLPK